MKINMTKVRDMNINNTSIRIMFYNIPCIRNQVAFRKLSYVVKIFRRKEYDLVQGSVVGLFSRT